MAAYFAHYFTKKRDSSNKTKNDIDKMEEENELINLIHSELKEWKRFQMTRNSIYFLKATSIEYLLSSSFYISICSKFPSLFFVITQLGIIKDINSYNSLISNKLDKNHQHSKYTDVSKFINELNDFIEKAIKEITKYNIEKASAKSVEQLYKIRFFSKFSKFIKSLFINDKIEVRKTIKKGDAPNERFDPKNRYVL